MTSDFVWNLVNGKWNGITHKNEFKQSDNLQQSQIKIFYYIKVHEAETI
ncbi:hypothetical protein HC725_07555 [Vibrio sp. S17_S38]|nr:hypothetical protein [Vibrio sp. S17_S38]MBD1573134.1 hypothetical protein [Vibrio sp. S17_S38]